MEALIARREIPVGAKRGHRIGIQANFVAARVEIRDFDVFIEKVADDDAVSPEAPGNGQVATYG
jgi:hypothetical protein